MRLALFTLAMPVLSTSSAFAQEAGRPVYAVIVENDLFGGTDRNYSNGLRIERIASEEATFSVLKSAARLLPNVSVDNQVRQSVALSHVIFTPEDIEAEIPDPADRPYAGWLNLSFTAVSKDIDTQDTVQLNIGVVGPSAGGEYVQTNWHELIEAEEQPRGWDYQIHDEPGIELIAQRRQIMNAVDLPFDMRSDLSVHGGGAIGNVSTYLHGGITTRIGFGADSLNGDFAPPRIRPALAGGGVFEPDDGWGAYLFAGTELRVVARDIFLDGNTFREGPRVHDKEFLVGDIQAGLALRYKRVQLGFTYVHRTEQFEGQDGPQRFGAISLSIAQ